MNFGYNFFLLSDEIRPVLLKPFDPISPHFDDLFLIEFTGNAESGNSKDVSIKIFLTGKMTVLVSKDSDEFFLVRFDLCELAVGDEEGIGSCLHYDQIIMGNILD